MEIITIVKIATLIMLIAIIIIKLLLEIKKKGLREVAISYIVKAEDMYRKGDNEGKMSYVIKELKNYIPLPFSLFITEEALRELIQNVFDNIKKALDYIPKKENL